MRVPILLCVAAMAVQSAAAATLSDADREALLDSLEKIRETADTKVGSRFRAALAAYRSALGSEQGTIELYLKCMEKENFQDENRKPAEFREWKRNQSDKLADPGTHLALRHQLRWLSLTLEAAGLEEGELTKLASQAQEAVNAVFRDAEKLAGQQATLGQDVTDTVFARAYEVGSVKIERWPMTPIALEAIYDRIILPPLRASRKPEALREAWLQRIQQEAARAEYWAGRERGNRDDRRGGGSQSDGPSSQYVQFLEKQKPQLLWQMEMDLFRAGDESGAAMRMLEHLQKYVAHPSAREWSQQFKVLLKPEAATEAAAVTAEFPDTP